MTPRALATRIARDVSAAERRKILSAYEPLGYALEVVRLWPEVAELAPGQQEWIADEVVRLLKAAPSQHARQGTLFDPSTKTWRKT